MSIRTRAGELRHRVRVERNTPTFNSFNEPVPSWGLLAETFAAIVPLRGRERYQAMQVQADEDLRLTMRYDSRLATLRASDRVVFVVGGKTYDIKAVMNVDERQRRIDVMATEHFPDAG